MDTKFIDKFPEIAEQIFQQLNNEDLIKSKVVDKAWRDLIDKRLVWKRMIQSSTRNVENHKKEFNLVLKKMPAENLKKFALACQDLANAYDADHLETPCLSPIKPCAPLHVAAAYGDLLLFKQILKKSYDKNPKGELGETPFHWAAWYNKFDICKFYIEHAKDKEPKDCDGSTPLYYAADQGHFEVFKLIFHHAQDKNPRTMLFGLTVLHEAAIEGHLEICKLIVLEVDDKNPLDNQGCTPLHLAAMHGHSEIYKFIAERVDEKNPVDNQGKTPLHEAIDNGHLHICRILLDILGIENPTLTEPEAKRLLKE